MSTTATISAADSATMREAALALRNRAFTPVLVAIGPARSKNLPLPGGMTVTGVPVMPVVVTDRAGLRVTLAEIPADPNRVHLDDLKEVVREIRAVWSLLPVRLRFPASLVAGGDIPADWGVAE